MPTMHNMDEDDDLYRGILEYDHQPTDWVPNPDYGKPGVTDMRQMISKRVGPVEKMTKCIGPYTTTAPIKTFITRNRDDYKNLRLVEIQKVASWEAVDDA